MDFCVCVELCWARDPLHWVTHDFGARQNCVCCNVCAIFSSTIITQRMLHLFFKCFTFGFLSAHVAAQAKCFTFFCECFTFLPWPYLWHTHGAKIYNAVGVPPVSGMTPGGAWSDQSQISSPKQVAISYDSSMQPVCWQYNTSRLDAMSLVGCLELKFCQP